VNLKRRHPSLIRETFPEAEMGFATWRGRLARAASVGSAVALAAVLSLSGMLQAVPIAGADSRGETVVQPVSGKSLNDINARFGTRT
jgi:hypothetical protein